MASSSKKSTSTTTTDMGPWKVQQPYLTDAFSEAQNAYRDAKAQPGYQGDFYAGLTDQQKGLIDSSINYSTGLNQDNANTLFRSGNSLLPAGTSGLGTTADSLLNMSGMDRTGYAVDQAGRYAQGMADAGVVDAAMRDITRQAAEGVVPNMYRANAATGNLNSDRAALAQGVVDRGLAEKRADIYGQLYTQGLGMAQSDMNAQARDLAAAGALYDTMIGKGVGTLGAGNDLAIAGYKDATKMATLNQMDNQGQLDNAFQKYQYNESRPFDLLNNYYNVIGSGQWGQQGTSTTVAKEKSTPSGLQIASGIVGTLGSLFSGGAGGFGGSAMGGITSFLKGI